MGSLSEAGLLLALLGVLLSFLSTPSHGLTVRDQVRRNLELIHHVDDAEDRRQVAPLRRNAKPEAPLTRNKRFRRDTPAAKPQHHKYDDILDARDLARENPLWRPGPERARIRRHAAEVPLNRVKRLKRDVNEPQLNRVKRLEIGENEHSLSRVKRDVSSIKEKGLTRVKRGSEVEGLNPDEPTLVRQKRAKRSITEPEVYRTKRIDRTDEEHALERVKRFKRDVSFTKRAAGLIDDFDQREMTPEKLRVSLERVKRFRRSTGDAELTETEEKTPEIRRTAKSQRDTVNPDKKLKSKQKDKLKNQTPKNDTDEVVMADKQPERDQKKQNKKKHRARINKDIHRSKKAQGENINNFKRERTHLRRALTKDEKELEKLYHMQRSKRTGKAKNREEKDPLEKAVKTLQEKRDHKNIQKSEPKSTTNKSRGQKKRDTVAKLKKDIARFKRLRREIFHDLKLKQSRQMAKNKRLVKSAIH